MENNDEFQKEVFVLLNRVLDYLEGLGFVEEDNGDYDLEDDIIDFLNKYEQEEK